MPPKIPLTSTTVFIVVSGNAIDSAHSTSESANERIALLSKLEKDAAKVESHMLVGGIISLPTPPVEKKPRGRPKLKKSEGKEENDAIDNAENSKAKGRKAVKKVMAEDVVDGGKVDHEDGTDKDIKPKAKKVTKDKKVAEVIGDDEIDESDELKESVKPKATRAEKSGKGAAPRATKKIENIGDASKVEAPKTKSAAEQLAANSEKAKNPGVSANIPNNVKTLLAGSGTTLAGLTIVVTGVPPTIGRQNAEKLVKGYGGKLTKAISGKTDFVVLGNEAGPKKLEEIEKHNIKTLDENELIEMLEKGSNGVKRRAEDDDTSSEEEEVAPKSKKVKV